MFFFSSALSCIVDWANTWLLQIYITKCCVLHLNTKYISDSLKPFLLSGIPLPVHQSVRDLGVIVNDSLTPSSHIAIITATTYQRINLIFHCFVSRDVHTLLRAYTTYISPLLEYNTVVWSPSLECDICNVEKVQRKFTKRLPGYSKYSYAERRRKLKLTTLELRRLHYDLCDVLRNHFQHCQYERADFFVLSTVSFTRGHPYKLYRLCKSLSYQC